MMKKIIAVIYICLFANNIFAQSDIVAKVGNYNILKDEFEKQFLKSVTDYSTIPSLTIKEKKEFLDLYINYKLKVFNCKQYKPSCQADNHKRVFLFN